MDVQIQILIAQLTHAQHLHLPVIIHCVRAQENVLRALRHVKWDLACMIHGFSGAFEQAQRWLSAGCMISIGSGVLKPNAYRLHEAVKKIPLNCLLFESDAPEHPQKGQSCGEPSNVRLVAHQVANLREMPVEVLADAVYRNAYAFLGLA